jgi:hypothetical protein
VPFHTRPQPFAKNLCAKPFTLSPSVWSYSEVLHRGLNRGLGTYYKLFIIPTGMRLKVIYIFFKKGE